MDEAERQAAWREERPKLVARHNDFRREWQERGLSHLELPALPIPAPDWYGRVDTGVPEVVRATSTPEPFDALPAEQKQTVIERMFGAWARSSSS